MALADYLPHAVAEKSISWWERAVARREAELEARVEAAESEAAAARSVFRRGSALRRRGHAARIWDDEYLKLRELFALEADARDARHREPGGLSPVDREDLCARAPADQEGAAAAGDRRTAGDGSLSRAWFKMPK